MGCCLELSNLCIISQFCEKGSLRDVLRNNQIHLPWRLRLKLAIGSLYGMQYLHSFDPPLIHRDIKSLNILVDDSWNAKLADFGTVHVARVMKQDAASMLMSAEVGTIRWSAPEMLINHYKTHHVSKSSSENGLRNRSKQSDYGSAFKPMVSEYTDKVDIYSMGIVLWEICTRKLPFEDIKFLHQIKEFVLQGHRLPIPNNIPTELHRLIEQAWHADPSQRPTASEMCNVVQSLIDRHDEFFLKFDALSKKGSFTGQPFVPIFVSASTESSSSPTSSYFASNGDGRLKQEFTDISSADENIYTETKSKR